MNKLPDMHSKNKNGVKFGVAGYPLSFFDSYKANRREKIFSWLHELELDWIELQNTYGVKMKRAQAEVYHGLADEYQIGISIHAPYYISLASGDDGVVLRSKDRLKQCFDLAEALHSERIIFHPGFFPGSTSDDRKGAIERIITNLNSIQGMVPSNIKVYPETAGKRSQIGSVNEILDICANVKYAYPCFDIAHIHGFEYGSMCEARSIYSAFTKAQTTLTKDKFQEMHIHMYPVEIDRHGEKKHKAFSDIEVSSGETFYPRAKDMIDAIKQIGDFSPVVICEAYNTQDIGARLMKKLYFE